MLRQKTTFIVGAGASKEFGFPLGAELKNDIDNALSLEFDDLGRPANQQTRLLKECYEGLFCDEAGTADDKEIIRKAGLLRKSLPLTASIDDYVDAHRSDAHIASLAKYSIARSILAHERNSTIAIKRDSPRINFKKTQDTWISHFFKLIREGHTFDGLRSSFENASFIIFNYDRVVEHFLQEAVKELYQVDDDAAAGVLAHSKFLHPYGSLGSINSKSSAEALPFGAEESVYNIVRATKSIKTYTEQINDQSQVELTKIVSDSARIVFLGFAFYPQNMKIITNGIEPKHRNISATAYKISDSDVTRLKGILSSLTHNAFSLTLPQIDNRWTCAKFFEENRFLF